MAWKTGHAEDLTQSILAHFCNDGWIETVDRANGRLCHFFKAAARHALSNHFRDAKRQKRGGESTALSLDEFTDASAPQSDAADDAAFDRHWAWTLFHRAISELAETYAHRGKAYPFPSSRTASTTSLAKSLNG